MRGTELKEARQKLNLTQADLARELGVEPFDVVEWEGSEIAAGKFTVLLERAISDLEVRAELNSPEYLEMKQRLAEHNLRYENKIVEPVTT